MDNKNIHQIRPIHQCQSASYYDIEENDTESVHLKSHGTFNATKNPREEKGLT